VLVNNIKVVFGKLKNISVVLKKAFPFAWELLFIILSYTCKKQLLFFNFAFFLGLIIYFHKEFAISEFANSLRNIKGFWLPLFLTLVAICLMYELKGYMVTNLFWNMSQGAFNISYKSTSYFQIFIYYFTAMILIPVAEALFYRRYIIDFSSKPAMACTAVISMVLLALVHAHAIPAALEYVVMALPILVVYMATKNMYVSLVVHLGFCIYTYGQDLIYEIARIWTR